jgi:hypothetical protein
VGTELDPKGQTTWTTYNKDGAVASVNYDIAVISPSSVSFTYDPFYPQVQSRTNGVGTTPYTCHPADGVTGGAGGLASVDGLWASDTITLLTGAG